MTRTKLTLNENKVKLKNLLKGGNKILKSNKQK